MSLKTDVSSSRNEGWDAENRKVHIVHLAVYHFVAIVFPTKVDNYDFLALSSIHDSLLT
jgi:hypothetical protein